MFRYKRTLLVLSGILVLGLAGYVVGPMVDPAWEVDVYLASLVALPLFVVGGIFIAILVVFIRERRAAPTSSRLLFRYKRTALMLSGMVVLGIAGYVALTIREDRKARADLAGDLKIKSLPASVHSLSCQAEPVWTDTLWHCYFEIEPGDFPMLLSGRQYRISARNESSYGVCCTGYSGQERLGQEFMVAKEYFVEPSEYEHGGSITIYTDTAQRHVLYDLYIE